MAIDYLMIGTNDMTRSRAFYDAVVPVLGGKFDMAYGEAAACYSLRDGKRIWISRPYDQKPATVSNGGMIGFNAGSEVAVNAAYAAAISHGGSDDGAPGPRPHYGPEFYGAYVRDPDGNKLCFMVNRTVAANS